MVDDKKEVEKEREKWEEMKVQLQDIIHEFRGQLQVCVCVCVCACMHADLHVQCTYMYMYVHACTCTWSWIYSTRQKNDDISVSFRAVQTAFPCSSSSV